MPSIAVVMLVLAVAAAVATVVAVIPSSLFGRRALLSVNCSLNNFFDVGSPAVAAAGQHMVLVLFGNLCLSFPDWTSRE